MSHLTREQIEAILALATMSHKASWSCTNEDTAALCSLALQAPQFQPAPKGNTMSIKTATNAIANAKVKLDELYARLIDDYDKLLAQDVMTHLKRADEALSDAEDAKTEAIQAWDKL